MPMEADQIYFIRGVVSAVDGRPLEELDGEEAIRTFEDHVETYAVDAVNMLLEAYQDTMIEVPAWVQLFYESICEMEASIRASKDKERR
jgi:hypothetical protein